MEQDLHLNGRGLILVPSYFSWRTPVTMADPSLPPVLVYPAVSAWTSTEPRGDGALITLLGATRAAILGVLIDGVLTSGELARGIGVSAATASEQTKVLRDAGLLTSVRNGTCVLHAITPLGRALLRSG